VLQLLRTLHAPIALPLELLLLLLLLLKPRFKPRCFRWKIEGQ
jgi:hypothetical protein